VAELIPGISNIDVDDLDLRGADVREEDQTTKESLNSFLQGLRKNK
jgi:hypothetical protein